MAQGTDAAARRSAPHSAHSACGQLTLSHENSVTPNAQCASTRRAGSCSLSARRRSCSPSLRAVCSLPVVLKPPHAVQHGKALRRFPQLLAEFSRPACRLRRSPGLPSPGSGSTPDPGSPGGPVRAGCAQESRAASRAKLARDVRCVTASTLAER